VGLLVPSLSDDERDARETVIVPPTGGTASAVVASIDLSNTPGLRGRAVYFALEAKLNPSTANLSLMIEVNGQWQFSNSSSGIHCQRNLGVYCEQPVEEEFKTRSYQAVMPLIGTARFGLMVTSSTGSWDAVFAGIAIAPIGARWQSLKSDDRRRAPVKASPGRNGAAPSHLSRISEAAWQQHRRHLRASAPPAPPCPPQLAEAVKSSGLLDIHLLHFTGHNHEI